MVDGLNVEIGKDLVAGGVKDEEARILLRKDGPQALLQALDRLLQHLRAYVLLVGLACILLGKLLKLEHGVLFRLFELVLHVVAAVHELREIHNDVQVLIVLNNLPDKLELGELCSALRGVNQDNRHETFQMLIDVLFHLVYPIEVINSGNIDYAEGRIQLLGIAEKFELVLLFLFCEGY